MRLFSVLGVIFYTTVLLILGSFMIILALQVITPSDVLVFLQQVYQNINSRLIFGLAGLLIMLISISFAQIILGKMQREKTIGFPTPSGKVIISLSAIEDLIKKMLVRIPEIKESRPDIIAHKKRLDVNLRLVLNSETNISELTTRLQTMIIEKIQQVLSVDEEIMVKIHVAKIVAKDFKHGKKNESEEEQIPFPDTFRK
ncbi:MAG: alkaline shock response membrane anchor protein AmaP [Candidatus Omnitrophota bacterium]